MDYAEFGRLLHSDPAFQNIELFLSGKHIFSMRGSVATKADRDRLRSLAAQFHIHWNEEVEVGMKRGTLMTGGIARYRPVLVADGHPHGKRRPSPKSRNRSESMYPHRQPQIHAHLCIHPPFFSTRTWACNSTKPATTTRPWSIHQRRLGPASPATQTVSRRRQLAGIARFRRGLVSVRKASWKIVPSPAVSCGTAALREWTDRRPHRHGIGRLPRQTSPRAPSRE